MITTETLKRLEFDKLLAEIARHARSQVSRDRIHAISPLCDYEAINITSSRIAEIRSLRTFGIPLAITSFEDIRPLLQQLRPAGSFLGPHELLACIPVLRNFSDISRQLNPRTDVKCLKEIEPPLKAFPDILEPLQASIDSDASIMDTASPVLRETRRAKRALASRIRKKIEEIIRARNIETFLQDDFITQRSGRWVIPVRMDSKGMVKGVVHDVSASGETAFMEPLEIIPFVNELENLSAEEKAEEIRILRQLSGWIREDSAAISACFDTLVLLDVLDSCARYATEYNLNAVRINRTGELTLADARHPLLIMMQKQGGAGAVEPLNLTLWGDGISTSETGSVMVITGPNAGGKTIALKTAGMLSLMALCGLPVPAAGASTIPLYDCLQVDIGDEQSIEQSHSTFSAHAARISGILAESGHHSLVLLDELGAGTEPLQGAAIACGVLRELQQRGATVIATTHLSEIVGFVHRTGGMINAGMEFDERTFTPLYRLVSGMPGESHALEIARRFGMPDTVVSFAREMLGTEGSEFASLLSELRQRRVELEEDRARVAQQEHLIEKRRLELDARASEIGRIRREAAEKGWNEAKELISATRRQMNELLDELKRDKRSEIIQKLRLAEQELSDRISPAALDEYLPLGEVKAGCHVRVRSLGCNGIVLSFDERHVKARIRAGRMELDVPLDDLAAPVEEKTVTKKNRGTKNAGWSLKAAESDERELKLIGQRVDEALDALETFLGHASLAGVSEVRIIHGLGSGRLRQAVREHLTRHTLVENFRAGEAHEGRDGATIVTLRQ